MTVCYIVDRYITTMCDRLPEVVAAVVVEGEVEEVVARTQSALARQPPVQDGLCYWQRPPPRMPLPRPSRNVHDDDGSAAAVLAYDASAEGRP